MSDQAELQSSTERKKPAPKPKPETVNIKIKSMGGRYATGGLNIAAGKQAKLLPSDICEVTIDVAKLAAASDLAEITPLDANCQLVNGEIVRNG